MKNAIRSHLKEGAEPLLKTCEVEPEDSLITSDPSSATKILDDPDYTLVKALQTAQQNFVITDPTLPDNPIVYASGGFLCLTGYQMDQILGRNCRFLQGPDTDPAAVDKIRRAIEEGQSVPLFLCVSCRFRLLPIFCSLLSLYVQVSMDRYAY